MRGLRRAPTPPPAVAARTAEGFDAFWELVLSQTPDGKRPPRSFFQWVYAAVRRARPTPRILIVADADGLPWETLLTQSWPESRITVVGPDDDESARHGRLSAAAPFDLLLQVAQTDARTQVQLFRALFFHLDAGGVYLCPRIVPRSAADPARPDTEPRRPLPNEDLPTDPEFTGDLWDLVAESQHTRLADFTDESLVSTAQFRDARGLGRHLRRVEMHSKMLRIENQLRTQAKLTESEADTVLALGARHGEVLLTRPGGANPDSGSYEHNLADDPWFSPHTVAPSLALRRYDGPTCSHGSIVTSEGLLWPDTFRHSTYPRLTNIYVEESAPRFGYVRRDVSAAEVLPGTWFHLDSEWPGHFGHLMTEQLGRLWAWPAARERFPDIKLLFNVQHDRATPELLPFELDLLAAFDIAAEDVHVYRHPCRPETLLSATSMISVADYIHPDLPSVWRQVGDRLAERGSDPQLGRRIFCTRPTSLKRACHNTSEVEDLFRRHGFAVVRPESLSLPDQVAMFRAADVVAGFAGSGLFTLAFCPEPKDVVTLGPLSYTARNEQLIGSVLGHRTVSAWSRGDEDQPVGSWDSRIFAAGFTVDLEHEGRFLEERLAAL